MDVKTIKGDIYTIGDILISINADTGTFSKDLLENRKKNSDQFHSDEEPSVNYCSEIRSNNNYKVLLIKYDRSDFSYYSFSGVNNENTKGFAGIMEYKKTDEAKAKATIDYLLKNLKFK